MSRGKRGHRRKSYPYTKERVIKYYCDKCAQQMPEPSQDGQACMYYGYNFPQQNVMIHIAYRDINVTVPNLSRHWCPSCLINLLKDRINTNVMSPTARIISDE